LFSCWSYHHLRVLFVPFIYLKILTKRSRPFLSFAKTFVLLRLLLVILGIIILNLCKCYIWSCFVLCKKKCQKKRRKNAEKRSVEKVKKIKCWKERSRIRLLVCTSGWTFISICVTRLLSSFWCNFSGCFSLNQSTLAYSLFASNLKSVFYACAVTLHLSYLVISTRHWISSLDCYLSLQQLEFRLLFVFIPYQAPHKAIVH
jgi:hypothetical protein